ncbi:MAG: RecX family transcriptional regulator [Acidobacteria bacterium]|nr:RecX family transcriptional regulator [Acidobacteriota bacterium]
MDAYTAALNLLSRRELSARQLRERLARRKFEPGQIDIVIDRLTSDRTLDDRRVALAFARLEASIRRRGRRRVLQRVQQLGISVETATAAVDEVFGDIDETAMLDAAIARRLKGATVRTLDLKGKARIVRSLVGQGFEPAQIFARLRRKGDDLDE